MGLPGVGVDRLSFSVPVAKHAEPSRWDRVEYRYSDGRQTLAATVRPHDGGPGVMVGVQTVNGRPWAKVECNPARFDDPDGCSLLPPKKLEAAASVMWAALGELVIPECRPELARVKRLDAARDFRGITSPSLYVEGLGPIKRPYARRSFTYNDPAKANAQTLYVGSNAGGVRLYDQHQAYAEKGAPEGSLRCEFEAREGWLEKVGIKRLEHLDSVAVDRLAAQRWEWSGMGTQVTGPVNAVQVVEREVQAGRVSRATGDRLLGVMLRQSFGYGGAAARTEYRHRDVMRRIGLTAGALWTNDLSSQAVGRLDFESGTEVLALAGVA